MFKNREDTPFVLIEDGEENRYTFILKDDKENEFWLYTLCGYNGSGPNATLKVLQLLGLKKDFKICEEGNIHVKKKNLNPVHKLNLLISQDIAAGYDDKVLEYNFVISINFKYAYQKHNLIDVLNSIGYMQHMVPIYRKFYEKAYLLDDLEIPEYEYYYYTNHIFTLNREFRNFSSEQVEILLKQLIKNNGGTIIYESMLQ